MGFQNSVTGPDLGLLCGSLVLVDEAAEYRLAPYPLPGEVRGRVIGLGRAELAAAMGSPSVVMALVLSQDRPQVPFAEDQHPVGDLRPVPLENSQQVLVAFGGHETCPRPVLGGLAWRVRWPRRGWRARVCCPAAVPRRGVLSLRVYRAVVLVSGPGSPRTGVHGRD